MSRQVQLAEFLNFMAYQTALEVQINMLRINHRQIRHEEARRIIMDEIRRLVTEIRDVQRELQLMSNILGFPLRRQFHF